LTHENAARGHTFPAGWKGGALAGGHRGRYEVQAKQGTVMLFLRLLGKTLLFIAFIAFVYDGARILATPTQGLTLTSLAGYLKTYSTGSRENLEHFFLENGPSYLWTRIVEPMLVLPVSILFSVFGTLLFLAGYRKPPPEIAGD
jgi:hypothetical protein